MFKKIYVTGCQLNPFIGSIFGQNVDVLHFTYWVVIIITKMRKILIIFFVLDKFFSTVRGFQLKSFFLKNLIILLKYPTTLAIRSFKKRTANSRLVAFAAVCECSPRFAVVRLCRLLLKTKKHHYFHFQTKKFLLEESESECVAFSG